MRGRGEWMPGRPQMRRSTVQGRGQTESLGAVTIETACVRRLEKTLAGAKVQMERGRSEA